MIAKVRRRRTSLARAAGVRSDMHVRRARRAASGNNSRLSRPRRDGVQARPDQPAEGMPMKGRTTPSSFATYASFSPTGAA